MLTIDFLSCHVLAMTHAEQFLSEVEAFIKRSGINATNFGIEAVNDPGFVRDLRRGRNPTLGMVDRVHAFMKANQPKSKRPA